ncbi:MAG: GPW/gp25 family protein [Chloroflexota bacterium]
MTADFKGTGWGFPVRISSRGGLSLSSAVDDIEEAIHIIISTPKGQRVMRPTFGCDIHELVFAPNNPTTHGLAAHHVEEALRMWEPRIELKQVDAHPDLTDPRALLVEVRYEVKATHDERSLVYPFYRIPGEE